MAPKRHIERLERRLPRAVRRAILLYHTRLNVGGKPSAELDPYRVIWVNPADVYLGRRRMLPKDTRQKAICHVVDGEWDCDLYDFTESPVYKFLEGRFAQGKAWEELSFYIAALQQIAETGEAWNGCRSAGDLDRRADKIDRLYHSIRRNGYRTPKGVTYGRPGIARSDLPEEVKVAIGRNGDILWEDGRHRVAIALLLGIPCIPVQPIIRHAQWQARRQGVTRGRTISGQGDSISGRSIHPDLEYLTPGN